MNTCIKLLYRNLVYCEVRPLGGGAPDISSMSLEEAREILGEKDGLDLTDDQLQRQIWDLEAIAKMTIKAIINGDFKKIE